MKYNVGDKVRIKSIDWYNENKDEYGYIDCGSRAFFTKMSDWCGKIVTIKEICKTNCYHLEEYDFDWTDEMIEGLVEEEIKPEPKFKIGEVVYVIEYDTDLQIQNRIYKNGIWNYIINIESAPFIFYDNELKKKKEYPKTYEECYQITGLLKTSDIYGYKNGLLFEFQKLLIALDAYWKIAGEEMGLGKPWEPDWNTNDNHFYTIHTFNGKIECSATAHRNAVLIFPTEEMRDAFYENFKSEIEICKELL